MRSAVLAGIMALCSAASQSALAAAGTAENLPGLTVYHAPKFPIELRGVMAGDGYVVMTLTIDEQGRVSDSIALAASHDAFAQSASEAISGWQFSPVASATLPRRETVEFEFKRMGVVTAMNHVEAAREGFISSSTIERKTVQWHELDAEPARISARMPSVSKSAIAKLAGKPLMINFIIDDQGRVRVPVISMADDRELSEQVLQAVRQWRYAPPLQDGKPVAVEVTRSLILADTVR